MGDVCWGYSIEKYPERWTGALPSREAALEEALSELAGAPVFWLHRGRRPNPHEFFPDAEELCQIAQKRACDEAGEVAEEFPDVPTRPAGEELDTLLREWIERHNIRCHFWIADGEPERIERATLPISEGQEKP